MLHALYAIPTPLQRGSTSVSIDHGYFEPETTLTARISDLPRVHPTANTAYVEPAEVMNGYYSQVQATARLHYPLDDFDYGAWSSWYSASGGLSSSLRLPHEM